MPKKVSIGVAACAVASLIGFSLFGQSLTGKNTPPWSGDAQVVSLRDDGLHNGNPKYQYDDFNATLMLSDGSERDIDLTERCFRTLEDRTARGEQTLTYDFFSKHC